MYSLFNKLDSVEKDLLILSAEAKLKCKINLSNKASSGSRNSGDYVKTYNSSKYNNVSEGNNLILRTSDYFVLSYNTKDDANQFITEEIFISYPNIQSVLDLFKSFDSQYKKVYEDLYYLDEAGEIHMDESVIEDFEAISGDLAMSKRIQLVPAIYYDKNDEGSPGVAILFNREDYYTIIPVERYNELKRMLQTTNLAILAQTLINFAAMSVVYNSGGNIGGGTSSKPEVNTLGKKGKLALGKSKLGDRKVSQTKPATKTLKATPKVPKAKKEIDKVFDDEDEIEEVKSKVDFEEVAEIEDTELPFLEEDEDDNEKPKSGFFANVMKAQDSIELPEDLFDDEDE